MEILVLFWSRISTAAPTRKLNAIKHRCRREVDVARDAAVGDAREQPASALEDKPAVGVAEHPAQEPVAQSPTTAVPGVTAPVANGPLQGPVELTAVLVRHSSRLLANESYRLAPAGIPAFAPGVDFLPQRALVFDEAPFERVREHVRDQAQFLPGVYQVHHREPGPRRRDVRDDRHVLRVEAALPDESGSGA